MFSEGVGGSELTKDGGQEALVEGVGEGDEVVALVQVVFKIHLK